MKYFLCPNFSNNVIATRYNTIYNSLKFFKENKRAANNNGVFLQSDNITCDWLFELTANWLDDLSCVIFSYRLSIYRKTLFLFLWVICEGRLLSRIFRIRERLDLCNLNEFNILVFFKMRLINITKRFLTTYLIRFYLFLILCWLVWFLRFYFYKFGWYYTYAFVYFFRLSNTSFSF